MPLLENGTTLLRLGQQLVCHPLVGQTLGSQLREPRDFGVVAPLRTGVDGGLNSSSRLALRQSALVLLHKLSLQD